MWTHEQLTKLNYHRHSDGNYYPHPPSQKLPDPITQHDPLKPLVKSPQAQKTSSYRISLLIERCSTKLQDFDNFVGGTKPLTDQLRYAGIIPDDNPASITAKYNQQKCNRSASEKVTIQITYTPIKEKIENLADPDKH